MKRLISLLMPVYNEQEVLEQLYIRLIEVVNGLGEYDFELLFVNDGSNDDSREILGGLKLRDDRVAVVDLARNFGKEAAMLAGLDHAGGAAVIIMDADLQTPPEMIPRFIQYWEEGYEDVYGRRTSRKEESWGKRAGTRIYYWLLRHLAHIPVQVDVGDFRLLDRKCVNALRQLREGQRYTKGMFSWIGYRKKAVSFVVEPRAGGKSKWSYSRLVNLAIEGITSYSTFPLRLASFAGLFVSLGALGYMLFIVLRTLLHGVDVPGYASLISIILFLGGAQLLVLGIIGEYLGKIFIESKNRPPYLLNEYLPATKYADNKGEACE